MGSRQRQDELVLPVTPGDMWDFDEVGTHILIEHVINGQPRRRGRAADDDFSGFGIFGPFL
jgi:hypothetical protein